MEMMEMMYVLYLLRFRDQFHVLSIRSLRYWILGATPDTRDQTPNNLFNTKPQTLDKISI